MRDMHEGYAAVRIDHRRDQSDLDDDRCGPLHSLRACLAGDAARRHQLGADHRDRRAAAGAYRREAGKIRRSCLLAVPVRSRRPAARHGDTAMTFFARLHRDLEPADTLGELIFGLIMVLTFTLGARLLGPDEPIAGMEILIAAIG